MLNSLVKTPGHSMQNPGETPDDDIDDREFWMAASSLSMARIWGNPADDVYAELVHQSAPDKEQSNLAEDAITRTNQGDLDQASEHGDDSSLER